MDSDISATAPANGVPAHRRFTPLDAISLGFFAAVLAVSIFAAVTPRESGRPWGHLLAAVFVFSYGVLAWWTTRTNALLAFRLGETLYLLGYVATICGIGAIAWQIGQDPTLLSGPKIPSVLARGSLALLSTVIGLIGMNYLRSHGQSLDLQRSEADQEARRLAEQIEQVLRKTEVERAQTFLSAFQSADLTQQLAAMSANLRAAAESLAAFKSDAHEVNQTWTNVLAGLNGLNAALSQFKELADGLNTSWADLGEGIKQAPELGRAAQTATAALNQLGSTVGQLQQTTAAVNAALAPVQSGLVNAVQMLQDRLEKLPPLADAVARFVELANRVAPTMEVLITTFQDIRSINENLRLAVGSLQNFNEQLNNANKATGDVATNADKLIKSTDNLVAEVANQLHKLKSLTEDWGKLGETVKELAPAMKDLKQQLGTVQEFSARVAELTQALARAEGILTSTTTKLDEVPAVVKDFIDTTRKLLTEGQPALPSDDEK